MEKNVEPKSIQIPIEVYKKQKDFWDLLFKNKLARKTTSITGKHISIHCWVEVI